MGEAASFADLLKRHRAAAGLTQEDLAERAGLSARSISDLERGIKHRPYPHTVQQLVQALALDEEDASRFWRAARRLGRAAKGPEERGAGGLRGGGLPLQPSTFIGRRQELEEVKGLLGRKEVRLLTLTGPGGIGKTRLALQVAAEVQNAFPDGVLFVSLAALAEPDLVPSTLATAVGTGHESNQPPMEQLIQHLRDDRLLLVIDNFEHLLPAAPVVSSLLAHCPQLAVLVTSRAVLHLSAEQEYSVPPLAVPVPAHVPDLDVLSRYDAVQLFLQRARAVKPRFEITGENAAAIAAICYRLDGLPLAIELAAARIRLLSPQALLARLSDSLRLLTGGPGDVPARQQTLRGTIDWSYSLLREEEQMLLLRLSVFAGGCTLEAAEAVCASEGEMDVLAGLSSLVEQSLVRQEAAEEPRFHVFETIREYAAGKLAESGEGEVVARRHAQYFVRAAERVDDEWARSAAGRRHIAEERDNLLAALAWLRDHKEGVLGLRLVGAVRGCGPGLAVDLRPWLAAFESSLPEAPPRARAKVLLLRALLAVNSWPEPGSRIDEADIEWAARQVQEAVAIYQRERDPWLRLRGIIAGASAILYTRLNTVPDVAECGEELFREGLSLARSIASVWGEGAALRGLGTAASVRNDHVEAESLTRESLAVETRASNVPGVIDCLFALAGIARSQGDYAKALELLAATIAHRRALGWDIRYSQFWKGFAHLQIGNYEGILSTFREVHAASSISDDRDGYRSWLAVLASSAARQGDVARAARLFGAVGQTWGTGFYSMSARFSPMFESYRASAREQVGESAWRALWDEGQAMALEHAVAYALEEVPDTAVMTGHLQPAHVSDR